MISNQLATQKPSFDFFSAKSCKASAVEYSIEKPVFA